MDTTASLMLSEHEQPALFSVEETDLAALDRPEAAKRYTAASLERNRAKRDAICAALAEGHGLLRIAKAFGVSHHLISALRDSRPDLVAIEKEQLSRTIGRVLRVCIERFEDGVVQDKVHPSQLPIAFGILSDKKALLDGDPTVRFEATVRHEVSLELVAGYLKKRGIELPVIDVESTVSHADQADLRPVAEPGVTVGCTAPPSQAAPAAADVGDQGGGGGTTRRAESSIGLPPKILEPKDS